ncbi:MAG: hypothetical protein ABUM51_00380 [Bacteroidota bacterium]
MKRIAAILLMGVLFFNWYGYRLLTSWLEVKADHQLEARLDENSYDESLLVSIKIPSTRLSYYNSSTQFERVNGQIEIEGVRYKYVKRRLFNDSLELMCIPNHTAMRLANVKNEFFKGVNDLRQDNGQSKKSDSNPGSSKNSTSTDYYTVNDFLTLGNLYFTRLPRPIDQAVAISTSVLSTDEQPPDSFFSA